MMGHWSVQNLSKGQPGTNGDGATVAVGSVTTGAPGSSVIITNTGTSEDAVLNFTIPRGNAGTNGSDGVNGTNGVAATVAAGTTTTGAAGSNASVVNVGTSSAATFDFTIPRGNTGLTGPAGPAIISAATTLTPAFGTAYPTAVPTKPSFISAVIDAAYTVTVIGTQADTVELRVGPVQAQVAAGTGGVRVASFRASVTGIALVIGLGIGQGNQISGWVPAGYYWAIRRVAGTAATINSAIEQVLG